MGLTIKVDPGERVRLAVTDTDRAAGLSKSAGNERLGALSEQLGELQELLFAARRHAVLVVLQDKKWFRNLAIAEATVDALAARRDEWNEALRVLGQAKLAELRAMRTPGTSAT